MVCVHDTFSHSHLHPGLTQALLHVTCSSSFFRGKRKEKKIFLLKTKIFFFGGVWVAQIGHVDLSHVTDLAFINIIKSSYKVRLHSKKTAASSSLCSPGVPSHRELTLSSPTERFWAATRNRYIVRQHVHARAVSTRVRLYVCPPSPLSSRSIHTVSGVRPADRYSTGLLPHSTSSTYTVPLCALRE